METCATDQWLRLPYDILLRIFQHLTARDLAECSLVAHPWYIALRDNLFWKNHFVDKWGTALNEFDDEEDTPTQTSWLSEFAEFHRVSNIQPWLTLRVHTDEVLHVAFSHSGRYFATSSRDCTVVIWMVSPYSRKSVTILGILTSDSWSYAMKAEFNQTDTYLAVTASAANEIRDERGIISIYHIPSLTYVSNTYTFPRDTYGAWFGDHSLVTSHYNFNEAITDVYLHELSRRYVSRDRLIFSEELNRARCSIRMFSVARELRNFNKVFLFYATSYAEQPDNRLIHSHVIRSIKFAHTEAPPQRDGGLATAPQVGESPPSFHDNANPVLEEAGVLEQYHCCVGGSIVGIESDISANAVLVNYRPWVDKSRTVIGQDLVIKVFDFELNLLWSVNSGKALTDSDNFFLLFPSSCYPYFYSSDEMGSIRVFDYRHRTCVCEKEEHEDVVSVVKASPTNPNFVVSVSDDHTIKLWEIPVRKSVPECL